MTKDEALKMAYDWLNEYAPPEVVQACKEALVQPTQKPVAYILRNEYNEYRLEPLDNLKITDFPIEVETKLYTNPAPSWQGLSDDEDNAIIKKIWIWGNDFPYEKYRIAIEQALKEKNNAL